MLHGVLAGPGDQDGLDRDRFLALHRLLEPCLLFRLEKRVVLERILVLVAAEGHLRFETGVLSLELEVILDRLSEQRRGLDLHSFLRCRGLGAGAGFYRARRADDANGRSGYGWATGSVAATTRILPVRFASY